MLDSVKRLLEVCEVVQQIAPVLWALLYDDSTIEDMFYCAPALSKTCLSLSLDLELVADKSEHDLAGMFD